MKRCTKCDEEKGYDQFHKCTSNKDGLQYVCKECTAERLREWNKANPGATARRRALLSPEKRRADDAKWYKRKVDNRILLDKKLKAAVIKAYGQCASCGSKSRLSVDHVIPRSDGGSHDWDNLQVLCLKCNSSKRNKDTDYRKEILPEPEWREVE